MLDIREEYMKQAAEEIAADIDFQVLATLLKDSGWAVIEHEYQYPTSKADEIKIWLADNCTGYYRSRGRIWLFEKASDAVMFSLKYA